MRKGGELPKAIRGDETNSIGVLVKRMFHITECWIVRIYFPDKNRQISQSKIYAFNWPPV